MTIDRLELRLCRLPLVHFFETSFGRFVRSHLRARPSRRRRVTTAGANASPSAIRTTAARRPRRPGTSSPSFIAPLVLGARLRASARRVSGAASAIRGHNMAKAASRWRRGISTRVSSASRSRSVLGGTRERIASGVSIGIQDSLDQLASEGRARAGRRLPAHQDQDQAGLGPRRRRAMLRKRFGTSR